MSDNTIGALLEAMKVGRKPHSGLGGHNGRLFITVLFAVIGLFLLFALLMGTSAYRAANGVREGTDEMRLSLSLIANSVRMNDTANAVGAAEGPEGPALVLTEHLDTGDFETRLYSYQGSIVEEYTRAGSSFDPQRARIVVASEKFDFAYANGLLTVYTDQGSASIALRSLQGGA